MVELQLSCNVICVKTSIENPKLLCQKKIGNENFFPIAKSINSTKSLVTTFQLFSHVFKSTKTCFHVKTVCVFFSGH